MKIKRWLSGITAALVIVGMFTSCSAGDPVMTFGKSHITENQFVYWLCSYKGIYLNTYTDMEDTAAHYRSKLDNGMTVEEYLFDSTVDNISMTLICSELFREAGLKVPEAVEEAVDEYIADLLKNYADGNKNTLNAALGKYGINMNMLKEVCLMQEINDLMFAYTYGENGVNTVTDTDRQQYYEDNYCRVRQIYVNNSYEYETDEDGYLKTDENGNYIINAMSEENKAAKDKTIGIIDAAIKAGEDFEEIYETYSEDHFYANGYYLTHTIDYISDVVKASFELEVGEITRVDSAYGVHFLMRLPLDEGAYNNPDNADFFADFEEDLRNKLFTDYIESYIPEVVVDYDIISKYSIEEAAVNNRF
ncbi:MAG: hypothetical protein E7658_06950 [Ruminococcaceae bacterium]|nr:hypothetical protein [Oscillospiraceae bacterium]